MADILTSKIQVPSLPDDTLILKDAEARQDLSTALATVTGNPLNFSTRSAQKAKETVISLAPIQDLHGYDHPWQAGGGKNKLPMTVDGIKTANTTGTWSGNVYTINNGTITIKTDDDGNVTGIIINGAFSQNTTFILGNVAGFDSETILSGCPNGGGYNKYRIRFDTDGYNDDGAGIAVPSNTQMNNIRIVYYSANGTANNLLFQPMIRLATETDATFAPYSNICPIDGRTETSLVGTNGKESTDPDYIESNNLTIQFGEKVYGAKVELEKGTVTVDREYIRRTEFDYKSSSASNYIYRMGTINKSDIKNISNTISDKFKYKNIYSVNESAFYISEGSTTDEIYVGLTLESGADTLAKANTWLTNNGGYVDFCYELATPRTITLTQNEISLLEGVNVISTDGDSISLTYRDGKVATLGDLEVAANNLQEQIDQNETMEDETTQLLYKLGVNNGLLFMEEV